MEIDILFVNAVVYIATFFIALYKIKKFNLYVAIWLAYSIVAAMGVYCVRANLHLTPNLGYKVSWVPYLFAYFTILVLTYPLYFVDAKKVDISKIDIPLIKWLSYIMVIIYIIRLIQNIIIYQAVSNTIGFGEAYLMIHEGAQIYEYSGTFGAILSKFMWLSGIIVNAFQPLYILYFFNRLIKRERHRLAIISLIVLAFLPEIIYRIASGSKGGLFYVFIEILFYLILFRSSFSMRLNRRLVIWGIIGIIVSFQILSLITESRIDATSNQRETSTEQVLRYIGEPYPNLGWYYYDKVANHPNGRRFFPEFFDPNPENLYTSSVDGKFNYWTQRTHVDMALFKTFWGDWYVEFGLWGSIIAIGILYIICYYGFLKHYWVIYNLPLVAFYFTNILGRGCFVGSGIEGSINHRIIISLIIVCIFIKYNTQKKDRYYKVQNLNKR